RACADSRASKRPHFAKEATMSRNKAIVAWLLVVLGGPGLARAEFLRGGVSMEGGGFNWGGFAGALGGYAGYAAGAAMRAAAQRRAQQQYQQQLLRYQQQVQ